MNENVVDLCAAIVAASAALLGLVALAEEHRDSSLAQRLVIGLLVLLCVNVALDSWQAAQVDGRHANPIGVGFALCLACSWFCRLRAQRRRRLEAAQLARR
jgi:hypothetical protein